MGLSGTFGGWLGRGLRRRLRLGLRLRLCRRRGLARAGADRLDLDLRQARAEAGVLAVAGALLVLADPDLLAELVADDARRDGDRRREVGLAVAADEQHLRAERLALVGLEPVHQQPLALLDAVLLATESDDRVAHKRGKRGAGRPRERRQCSELSSRARRPTRTWGHSPNRPRGRRSWTALPPFP